MENYAFANYYWRRSPPCRSVVAVAPVVIVGVIAFLVAHVEWAGVDLDTMAAPASASALLQTSMKPKMLDQARALLAESTSAAEAQALAGRLGPGPPTIEDRDVPYGGAAQQRMDVYRPSWEAPKAGWPAIVIVHGSGRVKAACRDQCQAFVRWGKLCMAPDGGSAGDVKKAVKALLAKAGKYSIDKLNVFLEGQSLGGTIASELLWEDPGFATRKFRGVILANGVSGAYLDRVTRDTTYPPLFLIGARDDQVVYFNHSKSLRTKLKGFDAKADVTMFEYPDSKHTLWMDPPVGNATFNAKVNNFLTRFVANHPPPCASSCSLSKERDRCSLKKCEGCSECFEWM